MVGAAALPVSDAVKPNDVLPPADSAPSYAAFATVTFWPDTLCVPFHRFVIACPPGSVHFTVQPLIAVEPAVTVTAAWKPPDQVLVTA